MIEEFVILKEEEKAFRAALDCADLSYKVNRYDDKFSFFVTLRGKRDFYRLGWYHKQETQNYELIDAFRSLGRKT